MTSKSGFNVGFHSAGTAVPFVSLSTYIGSLTLKSSGDRLVNFPLITLVLPASSNSCHQGPVAPSLFLIWALSDLTLAPYKLSIFLKIPPLASELLHFSTPNAYCGDVPHTSPITFPG